MADYKKCSKHPVPQQTPIYTTSKLSDWKEDDSALLEGKMGLEVDMVEDDISSVLFQDTSDADLHGMNHQALEMICCALLLILDRQCEDHLPGGKYWNLDAESAPRYQDVSASNVIEERFCLADFLVEILSMDSHT